jgi:Glycosyltransferase Family 4/Glycosyl transferases group 1
VSTDLIARQELREPIGVRVRHVLLVTRSFPPLNVVSSLRMYQWAKYWARDGVRVTVLTTKKHWFSGPCDLDWPPLPNVRVVEVEFLPQLVLRSLERWRDTWTQSAAPGRSPVPAAGRLGRVKYWLRQRRLSMKLLPSFEFYDLWIGSAVRAGRQIIVNDPVDVVVSSFGPPAAHWIGGRLKQEFPELLWVADYRDPWTFHDGYERRGLTGYVERRRERHLVGRYADLIVCVSRPWADQSRGCVDVPVTVVENGFDPEEQGQAPAPTELPQRVRALWAPLTLVYAGTFHAEYQDPAPLFKAIAELVRHDESAHDGLRVLFFGDRHPGLQRMIGDFGVAQQVRIVGYVERPTALLAQRKATALILLENQTSAAGGVLRAKMFEYLQAGRPILGVGFGADTEVGRVLAEAGVGVACGSDPNRIVRHLRALQMRGELNGFVPNPAVLARYRRDVQARRLLGAMETLLARRTLPRSMA